MTLNIRTLKDRNRELEIANARLQRRIELLEARLDKEQETVDRLYARVRREPDLEPIQPTDNGWRP